MGLKWYDILGPVGSVAGRYIQHDPHPWQNSILPIGLDAAIAAGGVGLGALAAGGAGAAGAAGAAGGMEAAGTAATGAGTAASTAGTAAAGAGASGGLGSFLNQAAPFAKLGGSLFGAMHGQQQNQLPPMFPQTQQQQVIPSNIASYQPQPVPQIASMRQNNPFQGGYYG